MLHIKYMVVCACFACTLPLEDILSSSEVVFKIGYFNLLTPNVNYSGRTAPLTSKVAFYIFIQQI